MIILWYASLLAPVIALLGLIFLKVALPQMKGEFRRSMTYLLIAATLAVLSGIITIMLYILGVPLEREIWNMVPLIYLISNIFLMFNVRSIERLFRVQIFEEGRKSRPYE